MRREATRLARALVELLPNQPEAAGLLALLLLSESRVPARTAEGALVLLRDQDRSRWDRTMIEAGHAFSVMPTPVVALNRAIAVAEVEGPGAALTTLDATAPDLDSHHPMHAARGTTLRRLGRPDAAQAAFERAAHLAVTEADRRFLAQQLEELAQG